MRNKNPNYELEFHSLGADKYTLDLISPPLPRSGKFTSFFYSSILIPRYREREVQKNKCHTLTNKAPLRKIKRILILQEEEDGKRVKVRQNLRFHLIL